MRVGSSPGAPARAHPHSPKLQFRCDAEIERLAAPLPRHGREGGEGTPGTGPP